MERASLAYFRVAVVRTIKQGEAAASLAQMAARGAKGDAAVAALATLTKRERGEVVEQLRDPRVTATDRLFVDGEAALVERLSLSA